MAQWATFAGLTLLSVSLFLALARLSQPAIDADSADSDRDRYRSATNSPSPTTREEKGSNGEGPFSRNEPHRETAGSAGSESSISARSNPGTDTDALEPTSTWQTDERAPVSVSTGMLLLNVALSQGVFGGIVLLGAWYAEVPPIALGLGPIDFGTIGLGAGLGIVLYAGNELATTGAEAIGVTPPETLRATLAPDSTTEWIVLFALVLPAIAFVEELLFRAALVGAISAGFAVSPWPLVCLSSVVFGLGHGAQGSVGVVITGMLGFVLAVAFVLTGSLLVVVLAHYLVNAAEFAVREGLEIEGSPFA